MYGHKRLPGTGNTCRTPTTSVYPQGHLRRLMTVRQRTLGRDTQGSEAQLQSTVRSSTSGPIGRSRAAETLSHPVPRILNALVPLSAILASADVRGSFHLPLSCTWEVEVPRQRTGYAAAISGLGAASAHRDPQTLELATKASG
jgi:hypothetical protein